MKREREGKKERERREGERREGEKERERREGEKVLVVKVRTAQMEKRARELRKRRQTKQFSHSRRADSNKHFVKL